MENLSHLPNSALTDRLYVLRKQERGLLVEFLTYLGEVDARRLHEELGFRSLFVYCTEHLGLPNASAFRRTTAARLLQRFPAIADYLADGRLCLTTLVELKDVLNEGRLLEVLDRAAGRTEDEVKALAASYAPRPAPPDLIRRLPGRKQPATSGPEVSEMQLGLPMNRPVPQPTPPPARIEPIAQELHIVRMTVTQAFVDDLKSLRAALSHQIPDGNLEMILHDCMRRTLAELNRRKVGSGTKRPLTAAPKGRTIPIDVERAVWQRDESKCAFIGVGGHRCGSTHKLQLHHIVPFGTGGKPTVENLSVRCSVHNIFHAIEDYGAEHMARVMKR